MTHVFHPGHHALHGITVVVDTVSGETYLGRFDSEDETGVHLLDVGRHDPAQGGSREDYIRRSAKFGVRVDLKHLVLAKASVGRVTPLGEIQA
ncbi:MAG TPA: hypothetical protein VMN37_02120 [Gemmatimonadales bacterium]|nr:hypothetical protein [Gemmatimonadales bacterium]